MTQKDRYFPTQRDDETVCLLLRRHWFSYVPFLGVAILMAIPLLVMGAYYLYYFETISMEVALIMIVLGGCYALFTISVLLYGFIDYYLDVDIVTDRRIVDIEQNGFFNRKISELSLDQIEDVSATVVGFFPTFLHYGDVHIQTAGSHPNFVFTGIPNPYRVSKKIMDLHDQERSEELQEAGELVLEKGRGHGELRKVTPEVRQEASKQAEILRGIELDKKRAESGQGVELHTYVGTMHEGEAVKIEG